MARARVAVNGSPDLFDFVDSVDVVNTEIARPDANVKVRGGGGGGAGPGAGGGGCVAAEGAEVSGGAAGEAASGPVGAVAPAAVCEVAVDSEAFAFAEELAFAAPASEPGFVAVAELDESGG